MLSHKSIREVVLGLNTSQSTICYHLKKIGKMKKMDVCLLYTLSEKNKEDHIFMVINLFLSQRNDPFLKNIISGEEKWVFYDNLHRKRQWFNNDESSPPIFEVELHERKFLLCVW